MASLSRSTVIAFVIVALAAVLRLSTITVRSMDGDEGASLYFASLPWPELANRFADLSIERHPLSYYVFLKAWRAVTGESDVALRWPSALMGVLTVACTYRVGRERLNRPAACLAALLVAISPLIIFQNQDARMYAPGILFSTAATWWLLRALRQTPNLAIRPLVAFAVLMVLAAYSHLSAGVLMSGLGLLIVMEARRNWKTALLALAALAVVGLVYAPYLLNIVRAGTAAPAVYTPQRWLETFQGMAATLLGFATTWGDNALYRWVMLAVLVSLVGVGVVRGGRGGWLLAALFVPGFILNAYVLMRIDFFQAKTLSFLAVPLALLAASASVGSARFLPRWVLLPITLMLGAQVYGLVNLWQPAFQREDFRNAAQFVQAQATEQDTVLMHLSWYNHIFAHYYPRPFVHPLGSAAQPAAEMDERLPPLTETSEVVWLVQAGVGGVTANGDPALSVERWFSSRFPLVTEVFPNGVSVKGYATNFVTAALPASATPAEVKYPNELALRGWRIPQTTLPRRDVWLHPPSTWVHVTLYWSATQAISQDVTFALSLEDEGGNLWGGELPRTNDVRALHPPTTWSVNHVIRQDFDINLNPATPAGEYKVVLRLFEATGAPLLNNTGEDWLIVERVVLK